MKTYSIAGRLKLGRVFDATIPANERYFLDWANNLFGLSPTRLVTGTPRYNPYVFSSAADVFKQQFASAIDTIIFHPDQFCEHTNVQDIWFLVFHPNHLALAPDWGSGLTYEGPKLVSLTSYRPAAAQRSFQPNKAGLTFNFTAGTLHIT